MIISRLVMVLLMVRKAVVCKDLGKNFQRATGFNFIAVAEMGTKTLIFKLENQKTFHHEVSLITDDLLTANYCSFSSVSA